MERRRYLMRVVRPVFEAAYLEVEAADENEAASIALASAQEIPEGQWKGKFDPANYFYDVHCVRGRITPEGHEFSLLDFPLYSVLSTNGFPYLRATALEPWMHDNEPMTMAALYSQWITGLIEERVGFYEDAVEAVEEMLKSWKGIDQKVVPLRPPAERRHHIALAEALVEGINVLKETD